MFLPFGCSSGKLSIMTVLSMSFMILTATGHTHHHNSHTPAPGSIPPKPPKVIVTHIILQLLSWGILLPIGAILGLARSRFHAPVQLITGLLISLPAMSLPHLITTDKYSNNAHSSLGGLLALSLVGQMGSGIFLKTNWIQKSKLRQVLRRLHGIFGKSFPIISWTQIVLGAIASLGMCFGHHTGQCLAHFIMGSAFIGYGIVMVLMLQFSQDWLKEKNISQEYLDCWVITVWGIINTFSEHGVFFSAGWNWSHKDMQHTSLGVFWAFTGALGVFLSRGGRRSIIPGVVVIISGWVFQSHEQSLPFSTKIHGAFGWTLMAAGFSKVIEVSRTSSKQNGDGCPQGSELEPSEHITPFLLVLAGVMFMSATEEQLLLILAIKMDHATYILCQVSIGSLIYLYVNLMTNLYKNAKAAREMNGGAHTEEGYENLRMVSISPPQSPPSAPSDQATSRKVFRPEMLTPFDTSDEVDERRYPSCDQ